MRQCPTSSVSPMLGLSISSTSCKAAPVEGTTKNRVFSSVALNSSDTCMRIYIRIVTHIYAPSYLAAALEARVSTRCFQIERHLHASVKASKSSKEARVFIGCFEHERHLDIRKGVTNLLKRLDDLLPHLKEVHLHVDREALMAAYSICLQRPHSSRVCSSGATWWL